ncbi:MAG TPA: betaine/proline/choline family ABC transporter ATP-binding protein, partial [Acidimicrobiales bacterium]|nr:betaine/proline/choline family ABC transporter ATP-binding protein [Acidimicrobiales bacterium]
RVQRWGEAGRWVTFLPVITLDRVTKRYGADSVAVAELSFTVPDGELCVLVGPSGCGKTTTLRMINRLIEPSGGRILIDGTDVLQIDPVQLRRSIGYVIQQGGLFPHRRVADNVATVPRLLGWDRARVEARVKELLDLVGLDPAEYGRRFPHELSGGERQRVGVARALGGDPPVLLMDEPFGAVDPITRQRLQQQFLDLQAELKKTIVFVTHDIEEATKLGDRIAVLSQGGVLEQYDTPSEVLGRPATAFVADFVGADRGVRRLAVTAIEPADLFHPPQVTPDRSMLDARAQVGGADSRWAVVVDDDACLEGWVDLDPGLTGSVEDNLVPFEVQVPVGTSLRAAFGEMLQHDVRWIPVVDGDRYLGVLTPNRLHAAMRRSVGGHAVEA